MKRGSPATSRRQSVLGPIPASRGGIFEGFALADMPPQVEGDRQPAGATAAAYLAARRC
ncbi:MAG TPA: hypothetical protein VKP69_17930 [Isosphaeraceae bacterium]|nr:hypothetical protein [Isosphaeraceae bacterium]